MALIATPGAANANSYATVAEFKAYWGSRPNNTVPLAQTDPQIEALLIHGTRVLSAAFPWTGRVVSAVQALAWPRTGMLTRNGFAIAPTVIPQDLTDALCELAGQLASSNRTADSDIEKLGLTSLKAGPVALTFKETQLSATDRIIPDAVRLLLVPSWYTPPAAVPAIFEVL